MIKNIMVAIVIFFGALFFQRVSFAKEIINLPPEELAKESVLPVYRKSVTVKNRNVQTAEKFEIQAFYGYAMTEPIFNVSKLGLGAYYNFTEDYSVGFLYYQNLAGLSDYAKQAERQVPAIGNKFQIAYKPTSTMLVDYNLKVFYGKLSLSKSAVINSLLYLSGAGGMAQYENASYPAVAGGIGQKFFFNSNISLRFDLRLLAHNAPVPVDREKERLHFLTVMDIGLSYLF